MWIAKMQMKEARIVLMLRIQKPEIALSHKEEDNASDKTKNDRSNTKQGVPKKPMTEQHNGVHSDSENQKSSVAEQKKATALKYSIAILLLCTSGPIAGVCTYFIISAVLSSAAVPVSSAVIAFVSASVMLSLAAYLIYSYLSAINSEKGVDPGRKQSQDLQKAKGLEHSNTPTPSFPVMSGIPIVPLLPPPPPPLPQNAAPLPSPPPPPTASKYTEKPKNGAPKKANESKHDRSDLLEQIRKGVILKPVPKDGLKIPQKQEEESVAEKQESDVQSRNKEVHQIRKVENQKTDKEQNNSESIQQGNYMNEGLKSKVLKQRNKSGFQDEELDSLDKQDDSLCSLEESLIEPNNTSNKELKKPVKPLNLPIVLKNIMSSENPLLNSPSNNLLSNSSNVSDDEEWDTSQDSMSFQCDNIKQEKMKNRDNYPYSASSSTKPGEVEDSSNPPVAEIIKQLDQNKNKVISSKVDNGINTSKQQGTFVDSVELSKLTTQRPIQPGLLRVL
ncbi:WH2 domain-containing protein [Wolbachia endosymbiont (group B) of Dendrolimus pini]|uniref:WH2 domain-containing protein n=1 Tax=Wolbachia endosymbiont (group B) of Dendrolimus pini TaxID=3066172 RepID=UPI003132EA68